MSLIKKRKAEGAVCPRCKHSDYALIPDGAQRMGMKPSFLCLKCGDTWQYGKDGGIYMELLEQPQ